MAYQTAFDLAEYEDDHFLSYVSDTVIPPPIPTEPVPAPVTRVIFFKRCED